MGIEDAGVALVRHRNYLNYFLQLHIPKPGLDTLDWNPWGWSLGICI